MTSRSTCAGKQRAQPVQAEGDAAGAAARECLEQEADLLLGLPLPSR
jgi:hypothetical protein